MPLSGLRGLGKGREKREGEERGGTWDILRDTRFKQPPFKFPNDGSGTLPVALCRTNRAAFYTEPTRHTAHTVHTVATMALGSTAYSAVSTALRTSSELFPRDPAYTPTTKEVREIIGAHLRPFFRLMDLTSEELAAVPTTLVKELKKLHLHQLLGVQARVLQGSEHAVSSFGTLHATFKHHPWIRRTLDVARWMLSKSVVCDVCYLSNTKSGAITLRPKALAKHEIGKKHMTNLKRLAAAGSTALPTGGAAAAAAAVTVAPAPAVAGVKRPRQAVLADMGVLPESAIAIQARARALVVGSLVSGGAGAAGMPYSSIPIVLSPDVLRLIHDMRSGLPVASTIHDNDMPAVVGMVKSWIKAELKGKHIALAIDGGSSDLVNGIKIVAVTAVSPALSFDLLLGLDFVVGHESGDSQAAFLLKLKEEYDLDPLLVPHLAADNATLNSKTARVLRDSHEWPIHHVRCVPHCLNLVIVAFCGTMSDTFGMATHLRDIRGFIKAGGGCARRAILVEWAVSLSGIDFADTRWAGFVQAVVYMMSLQSPSELASAKERLTLLAKNDKSARDALSAPSRPQLHWNACYEAVEDIEVKPRGAFFDTAQLLWRLCHCVL